MLGASLPQNEKRRLEVLKQFEIMDTDFEKSYDQIVEMASRICGTPIALISLLDEKRQWFKAKVGLDVRETPRELAFCGYVVKDSTSLIVKDTFLDERFKSHPLVLGDPKIRFYAGAPISVEEGVTLGTVCAIDRTPREMTPEQFRLLEILADQVGSLLKLRKTTQLAQAYLKELEEANASKDRFFSILSHDLKAPFNGLIGFSEILKDQASELSSSEVQTMASDIYQSSNEVFQLLNHLLEWSVIERGLIRPQISEVKPADLLRRIKNIFDLSLNQKKIQWSDHGLGSTFEIKSDEKMLDSIFRNLISNAIKFTPVEGKIRIDLIFEKEIVIFRVHDTGLGMTEKKAQQIMSESLPTSTRGTEGESGTGLGILLVRQFTQLLRGKVRVDSKVGEGTTVEVEFPRV